MSTRLEAEHAKKKLVKQINHHPAVNGIGFAWDAQGNTVLTVRVLTHVNQDALVIPTSVNSVPVRVEETTLPEAYTTETAGNF